MARVWSHLLPHALPRITGWRAPVFRIIWFVALAGALAGIGVSSVYNWQRDIVPARSFAAFGLTYGLDVPLRLQPPMGHEAVDAGVAAGDAITGVDRTSLTDADHPPAIARLLDRAGDHAMVRLRAPGGRSHVALLTRSDAHAAETYGGSGLTVYSRLATTHVVDVIVSVGLLAAAILMYARRPHDPVAALLSLSLLLLASYAWVFLAENGGDLLVRVLRPTAWQLMTAVLFVFPSGRFEPRWTAVAVAMLPLVWLLWVLEPQSVPVMFCNLVFLALAVVAIARRGREATSTVERQQIKWAVFGFGTGAALIAVALLARFVVPMMIVTPAASVWAEAVIPLLMVGMIACFALGLLVSLLRYRLYDADSIISRSATAAVVTLTLGAVFAASQKLCELSFDQVFGHAAGTASAGVAAALAAVVVEPVHHRVRLWADNRFQRSLLHLRRDLPLLVADLRETMTTAQLVDEIVARIVRGVRAVRCGFLIEQGGAMEVVAAVNTTPAEIADWRLRQHHDASTLTLDCDRDDKVFPLRIALRDADYEAQSAFGYILLGPRPDGSFYGKDEQRALADVADPIARALLVARRREAHEAEGARTVDALGTRLAALEQLVASLVAAVPEFARSRA